MQRRVEQTVIFISSPFEHGRIEGCVRFLFVIWIWNAVHICGCTFCSCERSFIMLKPDAVQRGLVGKIIQRFEEKGYKLVAMQFVKPSRAHMEKHYADLSSYDFFTSLIDFTTSGPVVSMVWEGEGVVAGGRKLIGETDPARSAPGTIRGDYAVVMGRYVSVTFVCALFFLLMRTTRCVQERHSWLGFAGERRQRNCLVVP